MKHEEEHADDRGDSGLRHEPLVIGISEGVTAGYEALDYVLEGLRQSLRIRRRSVPDADHETHEKKNKHPPRGHGEGPLDLDDIVGLFADLLESAGEVVEEVAYYIRDWAPATKHPKGHGKLVVRAVAGKRAEAKFHVHNTGSSIMRDVSLEANDLIGDKDRIESHNVEFDPQEIEKIPIGAAAEVKVTVAVHADTPPGGYRGLIVVKPGGASTILEVRVAARAATAEEAAGAEEAAAGAA